MTFISHTSADAIFLTDSRSLPLIERPLRGADPAARASVGHQARAEADWRAPALLSLARALAMT